jgi:hypothetical protein
MTTHLMNWLGALVIAFVLSASCLLDGPSENEAAQDVAADLQDAQMAARAQAKLGKTNETTTP